MQSAECKVQSAKRIVPYVAIVVTMICWSWSGMAVKLALTALTPLQLVVSRFTLSVALMLLIGLLCRRSPMLGLQRVARQDWPLFVLGGFFQPFLYYLLETYSYRLLSSPTIGMALMSLSPIVAPVFAWLLLRERVTVQVIVGILISTIGVLLLVMSGASGFAIGNPWGVLLALLAVCAAVLYTIVLRRIPSDYNALTVVCYMQVVSLVLFYLLWVIEGGVGELPALMAQPESVLLPALGGMAYLAVAASVVGFILYCYAVRNLGVTRANAFNNIRPVFSALWMLLFFAEQLPLSKWLGVLCVVFGLFWSQFGTKLHKK